MTGDGDIYSPGTNPRLILYKAPTVERSVRIGLNLLTTICETNFLTIASLQAPKVYENGMKSSLAEK